jgi:hypothetical protein
VYRPLFEQVWGVDFDINFPGNTAQICATPGGAAVFGNSVTPIKLSPQDRTKANNIYDHWGQSISFYERSNRLSPFTSKFDAFLKGAVTLTANEMAGYNLFKGKGNCNSCHLDGRSTTLTTGQTDTGTAADTRPLFTCFGYANLGLPLNPRDAFFYQTTPDAFGFTPNPFGFGYRDLGLGTFLRSSFGSAPNPNANWVQFAPENDGRLNRLAGWAIAGMTGSLLLASPAAAQLLPPTAKAAHVEIIKGPGHCGRTPSGNTARVPRWWGTAAGSSPHCAPSRFRDQGLVTLG